MVATMTEGHNDEGSETEGMTGGDCRGKEERTDYPIGVVTDSLHLLQKFNIS